MPAADSHQKHSHKPGHWTEHQPPEQVDRGYCQNCRNQRSELKPHPVCAKKLKNPSHIVQVAIWCSIPSSCERRNIATLKDIKRVEATVGFIYINPRRNAVEMIS